MAILTKDGKAVDLSRGLQLGEIKDFKSRGLKMWKLRNSFKEWSISKSIYYGITI